MSLQHTFFLLLLFIASAVPTPEFRDVESHGPSGILNLETRWGDTVGTAVQVWMNGPVRKNSVLHTPRTGPLSSVYRNALKTVRQPCQTTDEYKCEIAINGFGTIGEVIYDFYDAIENVAGRSTQVMVACRCVDAECGKAVLIRPVNVFDTSPAPNPAANLVRRTCLYEAVGNGFSDCHTELLRSVRRPIFQRVEYTHGSDAFVYTVDEPSLHANWTAEGQRGWTRDCLVSEIDSLETVTMKDLSRIQRNEHYTPADNGCKPPSGFVRYFEEEDPAAGEACYATYEYASAAASHVASQQDGIAIGTLQESYVDQKPTLVSDTELALTCSAAGLGVLVLWTIFRKQMKKTNTSALYIAKVIIIQILSYALEALPLHMALGQEIDAREWQSEFAFIDGSVALASDQLGAQGSADGSVLVLTAVLGTVQYNTTRVSLVAGFTAAFDLVALAIIFATCRKKQFLKTGTNTGQGDNKKSRWRKHISALHSRELQRRALRRHELQAMDLQTKTPDGLKNDGDANVQWKGEALVGVSTESLNVDSATVENTSADIVDYVFDVTDFVDNSDAVGGATDGMRRRSSAPPVQNLATEEGSHTSRESMKEQV